MLNASFIVPCPCSNGTMSIKSGWLVQAAPSMGSYAAAQQQYSGHQSSRYPPLQPQPSHASQLHHHHHAVGSHTSRDPPANSPFFGGMSPYAASDAEPQGRGLNRMPSHAPSGFAAHDRMGHYSDPMSPLPRKQSLNPSAFGTTKIARQSSRFAEGAKAQNMIHHQARWNRY